MTDDDVQIFTAIRDLHGFLYPKIKQLREETQRCRNLERLADRCMAAKQSLNYVNDLRKELNLLQELAERLACLIWVQLEMTESIKTEHTTAIPNVKMMAAVPKKRTQPEAYAAFMDFLGVPKALYEGDEDAVRPHWPGMVEYLSGLLAEGKPLPPGIEPDKTYPVYSLTCRKRMEVDATAETA